MSGSDDIIAEELRDLSLWLHSGGHSKWGLIASKAADEIDSLRARLIWAKEHSANLVGQLAECHEFRKAAERERDAEAACAIRWQALHTRANQQLDEARAALRHETEVHHYADQQWSSACKAHNAALIDLEEARARIVALEEGLRPFAKLVHGHPRFLKERPFSVYVEIDHCRRAAALLATDTAKTEDRK